MNLFSLAASIVERDVLRYTPAGVPIVSAKLFHCSNQFEAGIERSIEFEISALAAGEVSGKLNQAELNVVLRFSGFLTRKNRNSKTLVFHINEIEK